MPDYTPALFLYGLTLVDMARFGWSTDRDASFAAALEAADRALAVDEYSGEAYTVISYARSFQGRHDEAVEAAERAVDLSPNHSSIFHISVMPGLYAGNFETSRDYEQQCGRLSPRDQEVSLVDLARAHYHLGTYEEARRLAVLVLGRRPLWMTALTILVATLWRLGREDEARAVTARIIQGHGKFSVARWSRGFPYRRSEDLADLMDPLIAAGLPE